MGSDQTLCAILETHEATLFGLQSGDQPPRPKVCLRHRVIVAEMSERFGLNLDDRDKLLFVQFAEEWLADNEVVAQARANTIENFRLVFDERFLRTIVGRRDENEAIFKRILDDEELRQVLLDLYAIRVYRRARCPSD